jgi:carbohydrate kinase (thermoresistant glucokinase family)
MSSHGTGHGPPTVEHGREGSAPGRCPRIVVMGVEGAGKTTVGRLLARELGVPFLDADDLHSPAAIASMHAGHPLDDAQRMPWLRRVNGALREQPDGFVLACSALKRSYRDVLRDGVDDLTFAFLDVDLDVLVDRLRSRTGHFAGVDLLPSQLATLELGDDIVQTRVPPDATPEGAASSVLHALGLTPQSTSG